MLVCVNVTGHAVTVKDEQLGLDIYGCSLETHPLQGMVCPDEYLASATCVGGRRRCRRTRWSCLWSGDDETEAAAVSVRRRVQIECLAFIHPELLRSCPSSSYRLALSVCAGMRCAAVSRAPLTTARITPWPRERRSRDRCARVSAARWVDVPSGPGTRRSLLGHTHACGAPSRPGRLNQRSLGGSAASRRATSNPHRSRRPTPRRVHRTRASGDTDGEAVSTSRAKDDDGARESDEGSLDAAIFALALPAVASLLLDPVLGVVDTAFVGRIRGEGAAEALGGLAVATAVFNFSFKLFNFLAEVTGPLVASQIAAAEAEATALDDAGTTTTNTTTNTTHDDDASAGGGDRAGRHDLGGGARDLRVRVVGARRRDGFAVVRRGRGIVGRYERRSGRREHVTSGGGVPSRARVIGAGGVDRDRRGRGVQGFTGHQDPAARVRRGERGELGDGPGVDLRLWARARVRGGGRGGGDHRGGVDRRGGVLEDARRRGVASGDGRGDAYGRNGQNDDGDDGANDRYRDDEPHRITRRVQRGLVRRVETPRRRSASQLVRTLILQAVLLRATAEAARAGAAAPHQICVQVWWVTLFALDALAVAAQSLVASSLGAGDVARAREAADRCLRWALATGTAVGVGVYAAGPALPGVFTDDPSLESTRGPLALVASLQPLNAAVFVGDGVLQGAADFDYLAMAMAASAAPALPCWERLASERRPARRRGRRRRLCPRPRSKGFGAPWRRCS